MPPPSMRQQNPALMQPNMGPNLAQGMPPQGMLPQNMPQAMQQPIPQQMQPTTGAPSNPGMNQATYEWFQKQQINHPNAMMPSVQQQFPQMQPGQQGVPSVVPRQNRPHLPLELQQLLQTLKSPNSPQNRAFVFQVLEKHPRLLQALVKGGQYTLQQQQQQQQQGMQNPMQQRMHPSMPSGLSQNMQHAMQNLMQQMPMVSQATVSQQNQAVYGIYKFV